MAVLYANGIENLKNLIEDKEAVSMLESLYNDEIFNIELRHLYTLDNCINAQLLISFSNIGYIIFETPITEDGKIQL